MVHESWLAYEHFAMGRDELRPLTRRGEDMWGGVGFTLIDCLDVLLMMDLDVEYARCRPQPAAYVTRRR